MHIHQKFMLLGLLAALPACNLYFNNDDDDDPCKYGVGGQGDQQAQNDRRNPETGLCETFGGGGGGNCGTTAIDGGGAPGDVVDFAEKRPAYEQDWAVCSNYCSGLGEQTCLATPGCQGAYQNSCITSGDGYCSTEPEAYFFVECWATAPNGPTQYGDCSQFDALECSRHDECVKRHGSTIYPYENEPTPALVAVAIGPFESCAAESPNAGLCTYDEECGPGARCSFDQGCQVPGGDPATGAGADQACFGICVVDSKTCTYDEECGLGYHCDFSQPCDVPVGSDSPGAEAPQACGVCQPNNECYSNYDCAFGYECQFNQPCGGTMGGADIACAGTCEPSQNQTCLDSAECGPGYECNFDMGCQTDCGGPGGGMDPNGGNAQIPCACYGICTPSTNVESCYEPVFCEAATPTCPAGTTPGVVNGCWSYNCIEYDQCAEGGCVADSDVICDAIAPVCPMGQVPGYRDGCWSGSCIPEYVCEANPPPACEWLGEAECIGRVDCSPLYQGVDCSCMGDACSCSDWDFLSCQTQWTDPCKCDDQMCVCPVEGMSG